MKKLAITIAAVFATLNIFAQGTVNFSNNGIANSLVYLDLPGAVEVKAPAGTAYSVALYWAPVDPANPTVQPAASAFTQQGQSTHIGAPFAGTYAGGTINIAGIVPHGGMGWFQVKGWATAYGNTFEAASLLTQLIGVSSVIDIGTGDTTVTPPVLQTQLTGIGAIHIGVPEPAILGLGLFGGVAMLLLRRRK